jgi:hypothetical protein
MRSEAKVRLTLRPGDPGTKRLSEKYGEALVAVRYRYDATAHRRYTTVEIIADERPWHAPPAVPGADRLVGIRVGYKEEGLRRAVRAAGGRWDGETRLWWIPLHAVVQLHLEERLAAGRAPTRLLLSNDR